MRTLDAHIVASLEDEVDPSLPPEALQAPLLDLLLHVLEEWREGLESASRCGVSTMAVVMVGPS